MSYLKTKAEIELIRKAGRISALAMKEVQKHLKPGISTLEIDQIVDDTFKKNGAESAFKKVNKYKYSICATPNDFVVHGIPNQDKLKDGDLVGIDLGALYKGYNSDMAQTFIIGSVPE
ncbi:MAG: M24 family metallopeptidase, partial [Patescibacteria group bacterium]